MKTLRSLVFVSLALLLPAAAIAQETPFKFEFHGFVTGSMYWQDQVFTNGQGQGLLYAAPGTEVSSGKMLGGDIRNSRFSFSVTGPKAFGTATPRGYLEFDLFGPFNAGSFGTEQQIPRIRVAFAELKFGSTAVQVGQQNQLVVPQIPASIVHIANPITYGTGTIGWRTPGVRLVHTLDMGAMKLELAAEAVQNKWADPAPANTPATVSIGAASGVPMLQGRVKLDGKSGSIAYSAYAVGVWHQIDPAGFGDSIAPGADKVDGNVIEVGGRVTVAMVTVLANFYTGQATFNMLGSQLVPGDVKDTAGWVQAGVNLTKEFSIWGTYGMARPDEDDILGAGGTRTENNLLAAMVRYSTGGYQLGVEWIQNKSKYVAGDRTANQVIASAGYFF